MGAADRIALALGRPFTKKSSSVCKLRLQVGRCWRVRACAAASLQAVDCCLACFLAAPPHPRPQVAYIPLSEGEVQAVMQQQRLPVPARAAGGCDALQLPPLALRLLRSGLLLVMVQRAEGIPSGGLFKPYVKLALRVGRRQAETDASQASRLGAAEFSRPAALHLEPEAVQSWGAQGGWVIGEQGGLCSASCMDGMLSLLPSRHLVAPAPAQLSWSCCSTTGGAACAAVASWRCRWGHCCRASGCRGSGACRAATSLRCACSCRRPSGLTFEGCHQGAADGGPDAGAPAVCLLTGL